MERRSELVRRAARQPVAPSLAAALRRPGLGLIAEIKRRSPSGGELRPELSVPELAAGFATAGAAGLSVLTEPGWFGGSDCDLEEAVSLGALPVLRKDFVVDPVQVLESRALGAAACLLIVRVLGNGGLQNCAAAATDCGVEVLVEVHNEQELELAATVGADILGINNRDLDSLTTDLAVTERLAPLAPSGVLLISESGIRTPVDLERLRATGVAGVLVGESLMRASDPAAELTHLSQAGTAA